MNSYYFYPCKPQEIPDAGILTGAGAREEHDGAVRSLIWNALLAWAVALAGPAPARAAEPLLVDVHLNGQPARLIFNTTSSRLVLYPATAKRLGLNITDPSRRDPTSRGGTAARVELRLGAGPGMEREFEVMTPAPGMGAEAEGMLGWHAVREQMFVFDGTRGTIQAVEELPRESSDWPAFRISTNAALLAFELPETGEPPEVLIIDSTSDHGASLARPRWADWRAAHFDQPATFFVRYSVGGDLDAQEEMWAAVLQTGPISLTELPVREMNSGEKLLAGSLRAGVLLGSRGMRRMDMMIDGAGQVSRVRPLSHPSPAYEHNRLGAVFVPSASGEWLLARVAPGSPAELAGIEDGDTLIEVEGVTAVDWKTNPELMPLSRFWEQPAGARIHLHLRRDDGSEYRLRVVLREILGSAREE